LSPWAASTGTQTDITPVLPLLAALLVGWTVRWLRRGDRAIVRSGAVRAVLAFAAVAVTSFGVAVLLSAGCGAHAPLRAQLGALAGLVLPLGAFVVAADELDRSATEHLTWFFLLLGVGVVIYRFLPGLSVIPVGLFQPGADGSLLWVWLVALASGQGLANRRLHAEWRVALGWPVAIVFYLALAQQSDWLAGWIPPLLALAVVILAAAPRVAIAVGAAGGLLLLVAWSWVVPRVASTDNLYSLSTRLDAWAIMRHLIAINPVLGLGPANYYHCTPLFPIRGYAVHFSSHNNYIDIVAQTGALGLLCIAWFVVACASAGWQLRRRVPQGTAAHGFVCGCLGGLAGTLGAAMLGDWWIPFVYNVTLNGLRATVSAWIFLGALVALARRNGAA
jgi:O-antigen ligase